MANVYKARINTAEFVILPPTNDSVYQDFSLEPQLLRVRQPNSFTLTLNSSDADIFDNNESPCDLILSQKNTRSSILSRKVKRIGISRINFSNCTPNINNTNNQFLVYRGDNQTIVEYILPENQLNDPLQVIGYIVNSFNAASVFSGMNFAYLAAASPGIENVFLLTCNVPFLILRECLAVSRGINLWGFRPNIALGTEVINTGPNSNIQALNAAASLQQTIGPMHLQYTGWVDFRSDKLSSYTKAPNATTSPSGGNNLLYRLYLPRWNGYLSNPSASGYYPPSIPRDISQQIEQLVYFTWNPEEVIATMDIQIFDQFGNLFYVPSQFATSNSSTPIIMAVNQKKWTGVEWNIILNCEI